MSVSDPRGEAMAPGATVWPLVKHHRLLSGRAVAPPNSLAALEDVLSVGPQSIELDLSMTRDGAFVLLHDSRLEVETTGRGRLRDHDLASARSLRLRGSDERPATLAEVAARLARHPGRVAIQADLKESLPLTTTEAARLLRELEPLREIAAARVVVGSQADWNLRALRRLDPSLPLGLDIALHLDVPPDRPASGAWPPAPVNAYGYVDEHPLGRRRLLSSAAYLEDRLDAICGLVAGPVEFVYLRKELVGRAFADGLDAVGHLRRRQPGARVDVWTIDLRDGRDPPELSLALRLGADQITTNTGLQLRERLAGGPSG